MVLTRNALATLALSCFAHAASAAGGTGETLRIGGTGAGLGLMERIGAAYSEGGTAARPRILASLGSGGGLQALNADAIDIAVIARRVAPDELAAGLGEAACMRTPYVLATPVPSAPPLRSNDILRIYRDPAAQWPDGSRIRLILRPEGDAGNQLLGRAIPGMQDAIATARRRSEIPLAVTDQDNGDLAERTNGSLTAMGLAQLISERRALHAIALDGVAPSTATLVSGAYQARMDLCLIVRGAMSPTVAAFIAFVRSERGNSILRDNGAISLEAP